MKNLKPFFLLLILSSLISCKTVPPVLTFPAANDSLMLFTSPTEFKSKKVQYFTIDATSFSGQEGIQGISSIKYSLSIKNLSKSEISDFSITIENTKISLELENKKFMFSENFKNNVLVRFDIPVQKQDMENLIFGNNLKIYIKASDGQIFESFDGQQFEKKLKIIGMSL